MYRLESNAPTPGTAGMTGEKKTDYQEPAMPPPPPQKPISFAILWGNTHSLVFSHKHTQTHISIRSVKQLPTPEDQNKLKGA